MIQVIATDLDGTLFYPKSPVKMLPRANRAFLNLFFSKGGRLVVASSRSHNFHDKFIKKAGRPIDWIGCDGTFVNIGGKLIFEAFFEPKPLKEFLLDIRKRIDPALLLLTSKTRPIVMTKTRVNKLTNFGYFAYEAFQGVYREPFVRSDHVFYAEIEKGETMKIMILVGIGAKKKQEAERLTEQLKSEYPDFEFTWLNQFIEVTPKGCTKASGVIKYLDYLGISKDNVLVVGDSGNDVSMFDCFNANSYCMSHAPESVKAHAAHIIDKVADLEQILYPSVG